VTDSQAVVSQAAERYASALFDLAQDAGQTDAVAADLAGFRTALSESADLQRLIASPLYDAEQKARALAAVGEAAGFSPLTRKFLGMAAANRRADELAEAAGAFLDMVARAKGHSRARVVSAAPLDATETDKLKSSLRAVMGRDVELDQAVDPSLLAGLRVRVGSRLFDSSLRAKLEGLRSAMKEA